MALLQSLAAMGLTALMTAFVFIRRPQRPLWPVLLFLPAVSGLCAVGDFGIALSQTMRGYHLWLAVFYTGLIALPVVWLLLAIRLARLSHVRVRWATPALEQGVAAVAGAVWLLMLTNPWHQQFLTARMHAHNTYHWGLWVHWTLAYVVVAMTLSIYLRIGRHAMSRTAQSQAAILGASSLLLVALNGAYVLELVPFPADPTTGAIAVGAGLILLGIYRVRFFDLPMVALQEIVRHAPHGVLVVDARGRLIYSNATARTLLGLSTDVPGLNTFAFLMQRLTPAADASPMTGADLRALVVEANHTLRARKFRLANVPDRWVQLEWHALPPRGKRHCYALTLRDITAQQQMEEVLRHSQDELEQRVAQRTAELLAVNEEKERTLMSLCTSERRLAKAQDIARLEYWDLDVLANRMTWSEGAARLFEVASVAVPTSFDAFLSFVHADDRTLVRTTLIGTRGRERLSLEHRIITATGLERWVREWCEVTFDADGAPQQISGTMQDVTASMQAATERSMLATAVSQAAEMIMITSADGHIEYVNPAFERITGYSREDAYGHTLSMLRSTQDDAASLAAMREAMDRGEVWNGSRMHRRKDGTVFEAEVLASPVRDPGGQLLHFVLVMRDVTQERALERELRHAHKMEAMGTLAGGIAHDFNNILTGLLGYAELAAQTLPPDAPARNHLNEVNTAGERARDLVAQILTFSRQSDTERHPINLTQLTAEVLRFVRVALPSTIAIQTDLPAGSIVINADPTQMHQVLMNLCTNAGQAMAGGGTLSVELTNMHVTAEFCHSHPSLRPGPHARLTVRDTGLGMDRETASRIFEPYFTTKALGGGTGLGLAVVHGTVKHLGGEILVESAEGIGTAFTIYVPLVDSAPHVKEATHQPIPEGTETILLVDDEAQVLRVCQAILERLGYTVVACADGAEALAVFEEAPGRFSAIVTDKTMPGLTGIQLAREIRRTGETLPILMCTGLQDSETLREAREVGITEVLTKPLTSAPLGHALRRILEFAPPDPITPNDA